MATQNLHMKKRRKPITRVQHEAKRGKKSLFVWLDAGIKEWLENRCRTQRRSIADTLSMILEQERNKDKQSDS